MGRGLSERGTMGTIDGTNKTTIYTKTNIYTLNFTRQWSKQKLNFLFTRLRVLTPSGTILTKSSGSCITKFFPNDVSDGVGFAGKENFVVNAFNVVL
jgi:hypothetical protein